jgi:hypothetical protein
VRLPKTSAGRLEAAPPSGVHRGGRLASRDREDMARRGLAVDAAVWTAFVGFDVR